MVNRKKWSQLQIELLISKRKKGLSYENIGQFFNVTANAARKTMQRQKVSNKNNYFSKVRLSDRILHDPNLRYLSISQLNKCFTKSLNNNLFIFLKKINNSRLQKALPVICLIDFL